MLAVQLNSGAMPVPLRVIQEFELVQTGAAVASSSPVGPTASPVPATNRPEDVVRLFYERLVKFDTAGMVKLACPDARSDVETAISLLQSFIGFGAVTGVADVDLTLEDFDARTVSQEQDRAIVVVTGRLNAGAPLGSMDLDGTEAVLRLENGQWCLTGEESGQ